MKRYIIAIVALLSLTACKIDGGYSRDEKAVDRLFYNRAKAAILEASTLSSFAIYTDILLSGDQNAIRLANVTLFKGYIITTEQDGVEFRLINREGVVERCYKVLTAGKPLEDGAVWELTTLGMGKKLSALYVAKEGAEKSFSIEKIDSTTFMYYMYYSDKVSYHFDINYNISVNTLAVLSNISGVGTFSGDGYTLDFTILDSAPVQVINCERVYEGVVDLKYKDYVLGTEDSTTAVIMEEEVMYE